MMLAIYCRISVDRDDQKSIKEQQLLGQEFAQKNGWKTKVYIDQGISGGGEISKRPAYTKLLNDIQDGKVQGLFVWNLDRTARQESTWFSLVDLIEKYNVRLFEDGRELDFKDINTIFSTGMQALMSAHYRRTTSKKVKAVMLRKAREGKVVGSLPYGYMKGKDGNMEIDPEQGPIVKEIFEMVAEGKTLYQVVRHLNGQGIPVQNNRDHKIKRTFAQRPDLIKEYNFKDCVWVVSTLSRLLRNTTHKGERHYQGEYYPVPAIVSPELWEKAQKEVKARRPKRGKNTEHIYLLPPLTQCSCGKSITGIIRKSRHYVCTTYRYTKCSHIRYFNTSILDDVITSIVYGNLWDELKAAGENSNKKEIQKNLDLVTKEIEAAKRKQLRLEDSLIDGLLDKEQYQRQYERVTTSLTDLKIKESNLRDSLKGQIDNIMEEYERDIVKPLTKMALDGFKGGTGEALAPILERELRAAKGRNLPFEQKAAAIKKYIQNIEMNYTKPNKITTIKITWRLPIEDSTYYIDGKFSHCIDGRTKQPVWVDNTKSKKVLEIQQEQLLNQLEG